MKDLTSPPGVVLPSISRDEGRLRPACAVCHGRTGRGDGERACSKQPAPKYLLAKVKPLQ